MVSATCKYSVMCWPPRFSKWPSRSPPVRRRSATMSSCVGTSSMDIFDLVRAPAAQHGGNRSQNDFPVQPERPIVDVLHIEFHPGLEIDLIAPADPPQARQTRPHPKPPALPPFILFHLGGDRRPRAHQRH